MNFKYLCSLLAAMLLIGIAPAQQLIQKGKAIYVAVNGVPKAETDMINGIYPISDEGLLNMAVVGKIPTAGLSCEELEAALKVAFSKKGNYQKGEFQVGPADGYAIAAEWVTVGGRVKKPGPVTYTRELTIWDAVLNAGGKDDLGDLKHVKLSRGGKMRIYDLNDLKSREVKLQKDDAIEVAAIPMNDPATP